MRKDIHPKYKDLTIIMNDGTKFVTKSTYSKSKELILDVDFRNHAAWTGGATVLNQNENKVAQFNKRFGGISDFSTSKKIGDKK